MPCSFRRRLGSTKLSYSFRSLRPSAGHSSRFASRPSRGTVTHVTRSRACNNSPGLTEMATDDHRLHLPKLDSDPQSVRQRVETMERLLEHLFVIPGTRRDVGL